MEYSENLKKADISISSTGDNTIISAPASGYIVIDHINFIPTNGCSIFSELEFIGSFYILG